MPRARRGAGLLALLLLLGGCTQWYHRLGAALPEDYEKRAEGESLARVLAALGPPLRLAATDRGLVMAWESWRIRQDALGVGLGWVWAGADFLTLNWGGARIRGDYLVLSFDGEGRVDGAARVRRDDSIGSGTAVQPFGLVPMVNVSDILRPLPQHAWGGSQLLPLPVVLNNAQRPGMANTGVEQRGTPRGVGASAQEWQP